MLRQRRKKIEQREREKKKLEKKIKKNTRHADEISRFYVIGIIMIDFSFFNF